MPKGIMAPRLPKRDAAAVDKFFRQPANRLDEVVSLKQKIAQGNLLHPTDKLSQWLAF
jgi:hypothetical protein